MSEREVLLKAVGLTKRFGGLTAVLSLIHI